MNYIAIYRSRDSLRQNALRGASLDLVDRFVSADSPFEAQTGHSWTGS
jgi:hypothetical protein